MEHFRCCFASVFLFLRNSPPRETLHEVLAGSRMNMGISPLAGKPAPQEMLVDLVRLKREYYQRQPDVADPNQLVSFGTSGHRGSSLRGTFNEAHILAITQAVCEYRRVQNISGP